MAQYIHRNTSKRPPTNTPPRGLAALEDVVLDDRTARRIEGLQCGGHAPWRRRKLAEVRDLFALEAIAPRLTVKLVEAAEALHAVVGLRTPVPLTPDADGRLRRADHALLGIIYSEELLREPQPGFAAVEVLQPRGVFHANVGHNGPQALCLGAQLPVGVRIRDLILMSYGALTLQSIQVDQYDPAGIMHESAAIWWQQHLELAPLTREPFIERTE